MVTRCSRGIVAPNVGRPWQHKFNRRSCDSCSDLQVSYKTREIAAVSLRPRQRYTYRVLQTIQMKLILLCVWAERAILGSAKSALKFKYEI